MRQSRSSPRAPRAAYLDDQPFVPVLTVYEDDSGPVDTGLLNADGTKIVRQRGRDPIGFDLSRTR